MIFYFCMFPLCFQIADLTPPVKDWENFRIPEQLATNAPSMQSDIYQLLMYETVRYKIKPNFVFIDHGQKKEGLLNLLVAHMSILHLAYYEGETMTWCGSIYFQTRMGITLFSKQEHEIDLVPKDGSYHLTFVEGKHSISLDLPMEKDKAVMINEGPRKLFAYLFLLPTSLPPD